LPCFVGCRGLVVVALRLEQCVCNRGAVGVFSADVLRYLSVTIDSAARNVGNVTAIAWIICSIVIIRAITTRLITVAANMAVNAIAKAGWIDIVERVVPDIDGMISGLRWSLLICVSSGCNSPLQPDNRVWKIPHIAMRNITVYLS
jgi:hypothetical protein